METGEGISNSIRPPDKLGHRIKTGWFRLLDSVAPVLTPLKYSYFRDLGLNRKIIAGKTILDMGAGLAGFADVYHSWKGTKIISLDKKPGWFGELKERVPKDIPYIQADSTRLPFNDGSFDMVVSRLLLPYVVNSQNESQMKQDTSVLFTEVKRVLKPGGEYRFDIGNLFDPHDIRYNIMLPDTGEPGYMTVREDVKSRDIREKALKYLQEIDPNITMRRVRGFQTIHGAYFVLRRE